MLTCPFVYDFMQFHFDRTLNVCKLEQFVVIISEFVRNSLHNLIVLKVEQLKQTFCNGLVNSR